MHPGLLLRIEEGLQPGRLPLGGGVVLGSDYIDLIFSCSFVCTDR